MKNVGTGYAPELTIETSQESANNRVKYSTFVWAIVFCMANALTCWYYISFPLVNMRPVNGYPAEPAQYDFQTTRYISFEYWMVYFLGWNILLVYMMAHAILNNTLVEFGGMLHFLSRVGLWWNGFIFLGLSFLWLFFCNNSGGALCNDPRWCGVYYAEAIGMPWCPNTVNYVPDVTVSQIYRSDEFFQAWLFSIFFFLFSMANKAVYGYLRRKGMFREVFKVEYNNE